MTTEQTERLKKELRILYDDYRKLLLSKKYYAKKLLLVKKVSFSIEVVIALSTSSSFASLNVEKLKTVIPYLIAFSSFVAIIKPIMGLDKEIERLSKLAANYSELFERMKRVIETIEIDEAISNDIRAHMTNLQALSDKLSASDDIHPSRRRLRASQMEVETEIPVSSLWWPETIKTDRDNT